MAEPPSLRSVVGPASREGLRLIHLVHLLVWETLRVGSSSYSISFTGGDRWTQGDYGLSLLLWDLCFTCPSLTRITLDWNFPPPPSKISGHNFVKRLFFFFKGQNRPRLSFWFSLEALFLKTLLLLFPVFLSYVRKKLRILSMLFISVFYSQSQTLCE